MTVAGLRTGIELATEPFRAAFDEYLIKVLSTLPVGPYQLATAEAHGRLPAYVDRSGITCGAHDLIIAATAVAAGRKVLATDCNARFDDFPGVHCIVVS